MPKTTNVLSSILRPKVTATHFELNPQFIQFLSNDSFIGLSNQSSVDHLESFLEKHDTIKLTNVSDESIKLQYFHSLCRMHQKIGLKLKYQTSSLLGTV